MTQTTNLAAALAGVTVSATVSMSEIVDVFIARYEGELEQKRKDVQAKVAEHNKQIKTLTDRVLNVAKQNVSNLIQVGTVANKYVTTTTEVNDFSANWDKNAVSFRYNISIETKFGDNWSRSSSSSVTSHDPINQVDVDEYKDLMAQKTTLIETLNQVNTDLRSISSKERQVRGLIAQEKLIEAGMEELLQNPELLKLIQVQ